MSHEKPLGYLLALEGIALLRAFSGEHDRDFTTRRITEVRELLDRFDATPGVDVRTVGAEAGYREWARSYDSARNPAFADLELIAELLHELPACDVLDAACGTGRHSRHLASRGHRVTGLDVSAEMLEHARREVPEATFAQGSLTHLPFPPGSFDVTVCALALTHVADLEAAIGELARVVRPGGRVVIADVHPDSVALGSVPSVRTPDGEPARIETFRHSVGDYVRAALAARLTVERLVEPCPPTPEATAAGSDDLGPWDVWPWSLRAIVPEAAAAAGRGVPALLVISLSKP